MKVSFRKPEETAQDRWKRARPFVMTLLGGLLLLGLLAAVAATTWKDYRIALMDSQTRQLELVVQSISDSIQFSLAEFTDRLDAAADKLRADPDSKLSLARSDTLLDLWVEDADGVVVSSCYGLTPVCDVLLTRSGTISYWQYHRGDHHYLVLKEPVG